MERINQTRIKVTLAFYSLLATIGLFVAGSFLLKWVLSIDSRVVEFIRMQF